MIEKDSRDFITSLARGLDVLACFDENKTALSGSEIAARLQISRPTARRVLLTLESIGYLTAQGKGFALTPRVLTLCRTYLASHRVTNHIQPIVEKLSETTGETVSFSIRDGKELVIVARHISAHLQTILVEIGMRMPLYATAMGRAILSSLPEQELDDYFAEEALQPLTPATIISPTEIRKTLAECRENGFVVVDKEFRGNAMSVAVPVFRQNGHIYGAINCAGNTERIKSQSIESFFLPELKAAAREIEALLI